ncbi:MAG TPA: hypothetical protein VN669_08810, partial [Candidatus Acidoferrales bacterium]|nr:hypothetical protein [Candidatus Acidoferrales bacterium]
MPSQGGTLQKFAKFTYQLDPKPTTRLKLRRQGHRVIWRSGDPVIGNQTYPNARWMHVNSTTFEAGVFTCVHLRLSAALCLSITRSPDHRITRSKTLP